jgi:tetratricopeptide (TPR) repeat protein
MAEEDILQQAWTLASKPENLQAMGHWGSLLAYLYGRITDLEEGVQSLRKLLPQFRERELRWELAISLYFLGALLEVALVNTPEDTNLREETRQVLTEAQSIFQALGDSRESGNSLRSLGNLYMLQHNLPEAIRHWQAAREKLLAAGERFIAADIYWQMGDAYLRLGEREQAFHCYRTMSEPYIEVGHKAAMANRLSKESYEAVRYGDLDYARQLREQTLALTREIEYVHLEAWSIWEMGELQRVAGDLTAAREWFERAKAIFEELHEHNGLVFYHRGLGDIAQAQEDYEEAQRQFSRSLQWAKETGHQWGMVYAFCGLGRAEVGLQQYDSARTNFIQALQTAMKMGEVALILVALAGFASLYAANGEPERSVELSNLVVQHRSSWRETQAQVATLLEAVKPLLPEGGIRLQAGDTKQDLFETANQLLKTNLA